MAWLHPAIPLRGVGRLVAGSNRRLLGSNQRPLGSNQRPAGSTACRGVSPTIGTVVMVGIVVSLAVVVAIAAGSVPELQEPAPIVASEANTELEVAPGEEPSQYLHLDHRAGDPIPTEGVSIRITSDGQTVTEPLPATGPLADGAWTAGETARIPLDTEAVCTGTDSVHVSIQYRAGGTSALLTNEEVAVTRSSFDIASGQVRPQHEYRANVTVLGTGFTYGPDGPRIPIHVRPSFGEDTHDPWDDVNDGGNPRRYTVTQRAAGEPITVTAIAESYGWGFDGETVHSDADHGNQVRVLRDGDPVPEVEGMGDQSAVAGYVDEYVTDRRIDLAPNQAIFLMELGSEDPDTAAFDLQDTVVLVSMWSESDTPVFVEDRDQEGTIVCPEDG